MKKSLKPKSSSRNNAIYFINSGIACHSLVLLKELGLLDLILIDKEIDHSVLFAPEFCENYPAANSALITLEKTGVVKKCFGKFSLTDLGYALCDYIGLITMLFDGYGQLLSAQKKIIKKQIGNPSQLLCIDSITESSIQFGKDTVDPVVAQIFKRIKAKGKICDLGCGLGTRLAWLCQVTGNPGLGIENDEKSVEISREKFKKRALINFETGDITHLQGVWEDVTVVMQHFVFHDFVKNKESNSLLDSYLHNFPRLEFFLYVDIVAPSEAHNQMMPGYDYVHGLLGICTPTYEDTIEFFKKSRFLIMEEISIPSLPNTFAWLLCPKI